ncbi:MAG TPA: tetratricopeptide repeat protein, partial [Anaerolineales bacterium]|nr:tetratricopeptide repeat protein [Anaerolineales bacterium]
WIPAEEVEEFNRHIVGHIKVLEAYFGDAFQGFVPEKFGMQGKNAIAQFTLLANSYLYKRMDFYLEIKRNHKAVFLNYPFWLKYDFKNQGLKKKILQTIREAWFTSFPKIPLMNPVQEDSTPVQQTDSKTLVDSVDEDATSAKLIEQIDSETLENPIDEDITSAKLIKETDSESFVDPVDEDATSAKLMEQTDSESLENPIDEGITSAKLVKETDSESLVDPVDEDDTSAKLIEQTDSETLENPIDEDITSAKLIKETDSESFVDPVDEDATSAKLIEQTDANAESLENPIDEGITSAKLVKETDSESLVDPVDEDDTSAKLTEQSDPHFAQGLELGLSGRYQEAIDEISKAVEGDPNDVVAQTSLGVAFHRLGEDDRALSCYEAALQIDPLYAEAHYFRANILYSHGNIREAITGYTIALGLQPELIEAYEKPIPQDHLTDYSPSPAEMVWIAKPARRILDLNKSLETHPGEAHLFKERAAQYYRLRNHVQAIADYSSSLAIGPDDASVLHLRGLAYEQIGQLDRALEDYQRAIAINPQLSDAYIDRGVTFGQMGNLRQSLVSLTEAIRLAPGNPDGYFNRGTSYFQLGDFERAIDDFSTVIGLSPNDADAYYWRGISHEAAGRQQDAIADYRQFLERSQDSDVRAEVEAKLSQWTEGKRDSLDTARDWLRNFGRRVRSRFAVPYDRPTTDQVQPEPPDQEIDLYDLITVFGERTLNSTWLGSGVDCYGETAAELLSYTDPGQPIAGHDFLRIASRIYKTVQGDFTAFDPGAASHWIFIHAWEGSGFYIETNDPEIKERLKARFPGIEEVEGASPPYESLFIASDQASR